MLGFEIFVTVHRDRRQEFLQACDMLSGPAYRNPACVLQQLYENVEQANVFFWVEHWKDAQSMDAHLKSKAFCVLLGAIAALGEKAQLLRIEIESIQDCK
jgi:quinol monooxygenase YgiN